MRGLLPLHFDVLGVVLHVAAVQHRVLRRGDVDERGLHAGQHVLDTADVDVAVDLCDVVGGPADVVLDQAAPLEDRDLGHARTRLHAHEVTPDRLAVAFPTASLLEPRLVHDGGLAAVPPATATAATPLLSAILIGSRGVATFASSTRLAAALTAPALLLLVAGLGGPRRARGGCGWWRCGHRHGVADLGPTHEATRCGLWRRSAFAHRLRKLDVAGIRRGSRFIRRPVWR